MADARADALVAPAAIQCPATRLRPRERVTGTLARSTDCVATIVTGLGPLEVVGDLYEISLAAGISARAVLDGGAVDDYFGLPYIVAVDAAGQPVAAKVGTVRSPDGRLRAEMVFVAPTAGRWRFLVTGIGGSFSSPVGEYAFAIDYQGLAKRRAVTAP